MEGGVDWLNEGGEDWPEEGAADWPNEGMEAIIHKKCNAYIIVFLLGIAASFENGHIRACNLVNF